MDGATATTTTLDPVRLGILSFFFFFITPIHFSSLFQQTQTSPLETTFPREGCQQQKSLRIYVFNCQAIGREGKEGEKRKKKTTTTTQGEDE